MARFSLTADQLFEAIVRRGSDFPAGPQDIRDFMRSYERTIVLHREADGPMRGMPFTIRIGPIVPALYGPISVDANGAPVEPLRCKACGGINCDHPTL